MGEISPRLRTPALMSGLSAITDRPRVGHPRGPKVILRRYNDYDYDYYAVIIIIILYFHTREYKLIYVAAVCYSFI